MTGTAPRATTSPVSSCAAIVAALCSSPVHGAGCDAPGPIGAGLGRTVEDADGDTYTVYLYGFLVGRSGPDWR